MKDYVIVSDATSDLPALITEKHGIEVLPFTFFLDDKSYLNYSDNRELDPKIFYGKMKKGSKVKTTQINVSQYEKCFTSFLEKGKDVLCITLSSGISGTFNSATIAANELNKKYKDNKVLVVDSLCASLGEGMLVYNAALKKEEGFSLEELKDWLEKNKTKLCHWFTVDDLIYLKRGGRISSVKAALGTALNIKPVLHVDNAGKLIPVSKIRGRKNSLLALAKEMSVHGTDISSQTIFISHGDCEDDVKFLEDHIKESFNVKNIIKNYIGPVIGAHSGPGTIALFFWGNER